MLETASRVESQEPQAREIHEEEYFNGSENIDKQ